MCVGECIRVGTIVAITAIVGMLLLRLSVVVDPCKELGRVSKVTASSCYFGD